MAAKKKEEEGKEGDLKGLDSKSLMKNILKQTKGDHYNGMETVTWKTSSGSLKLDKEIGGVQPSLWRLCGHNNSGKTPAMLEIIRNILKDVPNSKAVWLPAEGRGLSEENVERCGLKFTTNEDEWEVGTVFVFQSNVFEAFIKLVQLLVKNNPEKNVYAFVVDSVDGLILKDDADKEITGNNRVAGVPALSKKMLQSLSLGMYKHGHWMGLISQVTSEIKIDPNVRTTSRGGNFSGGNALLHGPDIIINFEESWPSHFITDPPAPVGKFNDGKTKTLGQNVNVTIIKSVKERSRKKKMSYPIKSDRKPSGVWMEREIGDMMLSGELCFRSGSWVTMAPEFLTSIREIAPTFPEKVQGFENFYNILEQFPDVVEHMRKYFIESMAIETV